MSFGSHSANKIPFSSDMSEFPIL